MIHQPHLSLTQPNCCCWCFERGSRYGLVQSQTQDFSATTSRVLGWQAPWQPGITGMCHYNLQTCTWQPGATSKHHSNQLTPYQVFSFSMVGDIELKPLCWLGECSSTELWTHPSQSVSTWYPQVVSGWVCPSCVWELHVFPFFPSVLFPSQPPSLPFFLPPFHFCIVDEWVWVAFFTL